MLVFFDSDTQNDYILSAGRFAVPHAENIRRNLQKLTQFARKRKIRIISSVDRHFGTEKYRDLEISELSVWGGPFPLHCLNGTPGQKKIKETSSRTAIVVENKPYSQAAIKRICSKKEIVLEKQKFSAFSNPNAAKILKLLKVKKAVLYGVLTDYQVRSAALELRRLGVDVYVVIDAIKALNVRPSDAEISIKQMQAAGVHMKTTEEILHKLPV